MPIHVLNDMCCMHCIPLCTHAQRHYPRNKSSQDAWTRYTDAQQQDVAGIDHLDDDAPVDHVVNWAASITGGGDIQSIY